MKNHVVIAFGSNIKPEKNIKAAKSRIEQTHHIIKVSSVKITSPLGDILQPDYYNGGFLIETAFSRKDLKAWLKNLEDELGRDRSVPKFGPRTMDLDIVVFNGEIVDQDYFERKFLRDIVMELLPDLSPNRGSHPV